MKVMYISEHGGGDVYVDGNVLIGADASQHREAQLSEVIGRQSITQSLLRS